MDMGNIVVILHHYGYNVKMTVVLEGCHAFHEDNFSFATHNREVREKINVCHFVIEKPHFKKAILMPHPVPPRPYELPKLHENYVPI